MTDRKPKPDDDLAALAEIPAALRDVGKSLKELPGTVVEQVHIVEKAYYAGCASGASAVLLLVALLLAVRSFSRRVRS
jgi:hypothetical protein